MEAANNTEPIIPMNLRLFRMYIIPAKSPASTVDKEQGNVVIPPKKKYL
jgi:hypothetical protein